MHMCAQFDSPHSIYMSGSSCLRQIALKCGQLCANLSTIVCDAAVNSNLCLTLSRASVGMPSSGGCKGGGLVHWSGQGQPRTHLNSY